MKELCKNYKPEIMYCPLCGNKLFYKYAVSNKSVHFLSGKTPKIRNLGYGCSCNDFVFVSQTASKLSFKGLTYSSKVCLMIYYYKKLGYGREYICDMLSSKGIDISNRNVDNIYKKVLAFFDINPDVSIFKAYDDMLKDFNEIRLSIDVITIENSVFILIYNFFSSELLCIKEFSSIKDPLIKEFFSKYINENLKLSVVISIRKDMFFIPMLKSICPANTKFIAYQKF